MRQFLKDSWSFLKKFEVKGVKIQKPDEHKLDETIFEEFTYSLKELSDRICAENSNGNVFNACFDGILILIDEADNCSSNLDLGSFLKLLLERLQKQGSDNIIIGLAGLPNLRSQLYTSHPSSLRLFEEILVNELSDNEVNQIIDRCLTEAEKLNNIRTEITTSARKILTAFAEGYPHFVQQFGFCAFAKDNDNIIDENDCLEGALGKGGALELIGDRYYRDNYYNKIQKDNYRQILRIMADSKEDWVTKKYIKQKFRGETSTLNNAIKILLERHIILPKEGEKGVYKLQQKGFALWIKYKTTRPNELKDSLELSSEEQSG